MIGLMTEYVSDIEQWSWILRRAGRRPPGLPCGFVGLCHDCPRPTEASSVVSHMVEHEADVCTAAEGRPVLRSDIRHGGRVALVARHDQELTHAVIHQAETPIPGE